MQYSVDFSIINYPYHIEKTMHIVHVKIFRIDISEAALSQLFSNCFDAFNTKQPIMDTWQSAQFE